MSGTPRERAANNWIALKYFAEGGVINWSAYKDSQRFAANPDDPAFGNNGWWWPVYPNEGWFWLYDDGRCLHKPEWAKQSDVEVWAASTQASPGKSIYMKEVSK